MREKTLDERTSKVSGCTGNQYSNALWVPGRVYIGQWPFGKVLVPILATALASAGPPLMDTQKIGAASSQILTASPFFALTWRYPQFQAIMAPVSSPFIPL